MSIIIGGFTVGVINLFDEVDEVWLLSKFSHFDVTNFLNTLRNFWYIFSLG